MPLSVLILGATGRTGHEIMKQLIAHPSRPQVHPFCRTPSKLSPEEVQHCTSIQKGDAREPGDLANALKNTKPTHVIVSLGDGDSVAKTDLRTASAKALVTALDKTDGMKEVEVVVISSAGAGPSRIKIGLGVGICVGYYLRHVLADHTGQEAAFLESDLAERTWIVRASGLTNDKAKGKVVTFGDKEKPPTPHVDRADVAFYVVDAICKGDGHVGGRIENITTPKNVKQ
jgi:uncharacterized protein YbjT (DUF2867 family)